MKAFLLAAGLGRRLQPLTLDIPKCLLPIRGTPLLGIWLRLLQQYDVAEVLINTHHLAEQVEAFVKKNSEGLQIRVTYEPEVLGSGGTLLRNRHFVDGERAFYVLYSDNLTNIDLSAILRFHESHKGIVTVGLRRMDMPQTRGIAVIDSESRVVEFEEKPTHPKSDLANTGILVASPGLFEYIPDRLPCDIGYDVLPRLVGHAYGFILEGYLRDIGTLESYKLAQSEWASENFLSSKRR
jgi:mannose-1-phosphate guanylyltransferase